MNDMSPIRMAAEILKAWFLDKSADKRFPVDCRAIAEGFGITVQGDKLDLEFEGGLFIDSEIKAIIYNKNIREKGRRNFTVAHELGHYFLHRNKQELRCSFAELTDFQINQIHPKQIEQEANRFATTLLMPSGDFRNNIRGSVPSISLLSQLAERYQTSLTATAYRMVEVSPQPLALIVAKQGRVHRWLRNNHMKQAGLWMQKGSIVPSFELSIDNNLIDPQEWLDRPHASLWSLQQSSIFMPNYAQTLILVSAESKEYEGDLWDNSSDSVDLLPR